MDYIYITDSSNNKQPYLIHSIFELKGFDYQYIIYSELDNSRFYVAKYKENVEDLNTDLSEKELSLCNEIFKEVVSSATRSKSQS